MELIDGFNGLAKWLRLVIMAVVVLLILWFFLALLIVPPFTVMQTHSAALKKVEDQIKNLKSPVNNPRAIFSNQLVAADQTSSIMRLLLGKVPKLELLQFKKLPERKTGDLFEHGFELMLKGTYHATLNYFKLLQWAGQPLFWRKMDYRVTNYPIATITLQFSSLSPQAHWFEVGAAKQKAAVNRPQQVSIPANKGT